jgi:predicted ATPase/DNA-binding CsgD family transcriptional regulator
LIVGVPSPGTPLLARDDEVENVVALLRAGDVGLVTITGPGGVGKTRLAIEVARRLSAELHDGAVFVDLSGLAEPDKVISTIAGTLEVGLSGIDEPAVAVQRALARRELLLVLDNFEQVLAAAGVPVELHERCPGVRVLITSRAPLRVRAERVFRLAGLPVPIRSSDPDLTAVRQFASVELFCQRASAIRPDFMLSDDNAVAVARISRAVDGLPLAIELAAARVTHLHPAVLAERLESQSSNAPLDTLGRGANDLPVRQRTMRDTIAWSYNLLHPHEQRLLRRLAIFDGDCSLDAIESVCADHSLTLESDLEMVGGVLLDTLAALVDLHLVEPDDRLRDEARFGMLVTIREFGREHLEADERDALRARHAHYYAALVDEAAVGLETRAAQTWARRLDHELTELRAALRHLLATGRIVDGLRVVTGTGRFWLNQGHIAEGRQWLAAFLGAATPDLVPARERASALMWTARLAMDELASAEPGASAVLRTQLEEALALARSVPDEQLELEALLFMTSILMPDDDLEHTLLMADEGIARAETANRWRLAELFHGTALLAHWAGDRDRAAGLAADARMLADELGNERLSIESRLTLSFTTPGTTLAATAPVLADIVPRAEALGDRRVLAWLYPAVGSQALSAGSLDDAAPWFRTSLELARDSGYWHAGAFGMMGAQAVAYLRRQPEKAARLSGVLSQQLPTLRRSTPPQHLRTWETLLAAVRTAMGDDAYDAAARAGAAMTWDDALDEAMTICHGEVDGASVPTRTTSRPHRPWETELTERELDVLRLIAAGGTNKDVAAALGIRAKTVMHHSVAIYRKLGVRGRAEATAYAYRNNLIEVVEPA